MKNICIKILAILIFAFLFVSAVKPIIIGSIPFWFDPARDLMAAWDNLRKPTLIGSSTGIPGIFYGPFWIWLLSLPLVISRDPRFVTFIVATVPYFVFFPLVLFKFSKVFSRYISFVLWVLFILSFGAYSNQLWNPNPAPLIYLILVYLILTFEAKTSRKNYLRSFLTGLSLGLLLNFHMSFGLGVCAGMIVFFIISFFTELKKFSSYIRLIPVMITGFLMAFIPFALFEVRHGFNQVKAFLLTMRKAVLENSAIVGQVGFSKEKIVSSFFGRFNDLLKTPKIPTILIIIFVLYLLYLVIRKKIKISFFDLRLFLLLFLSAAGILFVYLTSKNPVWDYHFLSIEVIFLLFLGLVMKKMPLFNIAVSLWVFFLLTTNVFSFFKTFNNKIDYTCMRSEKQAVDLIYQDNKGTGFAVFAQNPAIYTYEYDYLFKWLGGEKYHQLPETDLSAVKTVYLIIPKEPEKDQQGFILYKTPPQEFKTAKEWLMDDKTRVVKRVRYIEVEK